jgi:putative transcriptional regulator
MARMNLYKLLKNSPYSQKDVAIYTGINKNTISRYVNNTFEKIDKDHIDLLCDFFKCTPNDLFDLDPVQRHLFNPIEFYQQDNDENLILDQNFANYQTTGMGVDYSRLKENPSNVLLEQEIYRFYSNLLLLLTNYDFPPNAIDYMSNNLGVASISFNTIPLYSFIFGHSNFLCEALSYTPFGNDFIPTLTYLQNVFYQGRINSLSEFDKQNLINSFEYFDKNYFSNDNNRAGFYYTSKQKD